MGRFCVACVVFALIAVALDAAGEPPTLPILAQWKEQNTSLEKAGRQVIRTPADWERAWKAAHTRMIPPPEVPRVDFSKNMVLAAYLGPRRTGGYDIEFSRVEIVNGMLKVYVREKTPGPGPKTQATTSPVSFALVPRQDMKVEFLDRR
jgi:hypothetical protein